MKNSLIKLIESLLPFEKEKNIEKEIIDNTIFQIEKLPVLISFLIKVTSLIFNFLLFKNLKLFYYCSLIDRKHLINSHIVSKLFNSNILRILRTFSWMCFYDHPEVQKKIGYKNTIN